MHVDCSKGQAQNDDSIVTLRGDIAASLVNSGNDIPIIIYALKNHRRESACFLRLIFMKSGPLHLKVCHDGLVYMVFISTSRYACFLAECTGSLWAGGSC